MTGNPGSHDASMHRRRFLRRAGGAGVLAWAAPQVVSMPVAGAQESGTPPPDDGCLARGLLFSDDFEGEEVSGSPLNYTSFDHWDVTDGTVDLIRNNEHSFVPVARGYVVDLDGSTGNAGVLSLKADQRPVTVVGRRYTLEFLLAGNLRNSTSETVEVRFGPLAPVILTRTGSAPFSAETLSFIAATAAPIDLSFENTFVSGTGDNQGALVDDVNITESCV